MSDTADKVQLRFEDLNLSDAMMSALKAARYEVPSPIQAGVIPLAMEGKDVLGQARTGTGKTAAFGIPIIEKIPSGKGPHALILVPTRELAVQVRDEITKLSKGRGTQCVALYGDKPIRAQIEKLHRNPGSWSARPVGSST